VKTILVTGASGIVGYGTLRSLRSGRRDYRLIGSSIYDDSVAPAFCDAFVKAPPTTSPTYLEWLVRIVQKYSVDLVIPGIEIDMYKCAECAESLRQRGINVLLNNTDLLCLCKDKWNFYERLHHVGLLAIPSRIEGDFETLSYDFGLPFILKPRRGFGSKGIVRIFNAKDFARHAGYLGSGLIAQPIVGTDEEEYTTSAFCDGKGGYYASMTLRRKLSKDGFTDRAEVATLENLDEDIWALCQKFRPIGPTNFQFRLHNGSLKLLEINPRISSSTSIRTAFGYNESIMAVDYFLDGIIPVQPVIRQGHAVRYTEDFIFYDDKK